MKSPLPQTRMRRWQLIEIYIYLTVMPIVMPDDPIQYKIFPRPLNNWPIILRESVPIILKLCDSPPERVYPSSLGPG